MGWRGTHLVPNESRACAHTHHQFITMPIWCLFFFVHTVDRFNPRPDKLTDVLKHLLHYYPFSLLYVTFSHDDDGFHHGDGNCPPARPNRWLNKWREKLHHHSTGLFQPFLVRLSFSSCWFFSSRSLCAVMGRGPLFFFCGRPAKFHIETTRRELLVCYMSPTEKLLGVPIILLHIRKEKESVLWFSSLNRYSSLCMYRAAPRLSVPFF